jgi:hypothetical protein
MLGELMDNHNFFEANCARFFNASGHIAALQNIQKYSLKKEQHLIVRNCLYLVACLVDRETPRSEQIGNYQNVLNISTQTIQTFLDDHGVCTTACYDVANLALHNDNFTVGILNSGAIPILVDTMERLPDDELAQEAVACILWILLTCENQQQQIVNAINGTKALKVLAVAKCDYPNNREFHKWAHYCMKEFLEHCHEASNRSTQQVE